MITAIDTNNKSPSLRSRLEQAKGLLHKAVEQ